ncbi:APH(3')-II family aminoglycoside O-phosphotransferase [Hyphomicrobium sp.]|uniref:APH(3')-II family aminoglycoside O-phosphotransferase n=1 Tax=Hyphomicrobium sp. TaxID=82 RepID=UPI002E358C6D|nr:APH(3') family aminoglycoside O-phosphotransferase [Hyphomicrobium sp.]HEX2841893.1 APH(3') family aminoglycoside O-phosphotransferase [Hyphomicrobium sp.]
MQHGKPSGVPDTLDERVSGYSWTLQTIGRSDASVFRLEAAGQPTFFVKTERVSFFSELPGEVARLRWLADQKMACPSILAETRHGEHDWLLMSAVPGHDLASPLHLDARRTIEIAADALRVLHGRDIETCPFDQRLDVKIACARQRAEAGLVDTDDFDEERLGRPVSELVEELFARRPKDEDLVVAHGDACLPNLLAENGSFTGFIDCGRLGVADRHQDLALASWSVQYNLGEQWVAPFLKRYGGDHDPERLAFYRFLDEFF